MIVQASAASTSSFQTILGFFELGTILGSSLYFGGSAGNHYDKVVPFLVDKVPPRLAKVLAFFFIGGSCAFQFALGRKITQGCDFFYPLKLSGDWSPDFAIRQGLRISCFSFAGMIALLIFNDVMSRHRHATIVGLTLKRAIGFSEVGCLLGAFLYVGACAAKCWERHLPFSIVSSGNKNLISVTKTLVFFLAGGGFASLAATARKTIMGRDLFYPLSMPTNWFVFLSWQGGFVFFISTIGAMVTRVADTLASMTGVGIKVGGASLLSCLIAMFLFVNPGEDNEKRFINALIENKTLGRWANIVGTGLALGGYFFLVRLLQLKGISIGDLRMLFLLPICLTWFLFWGTVSGVALVGALRFMLTFVEGFKLWLQP
jgi:hypothetical protein